MTESTPLSSARRCESQGCTSFPKYNREGKSRGRFCITHKIPGMVLVYTTPVTILVKKKSG
jgi:hypothetical protein